MGGFPTAGSGGGGGGTDTGALQKAQNLADIPDLGVAHTNFGFYPNTYATGNYPTANYQPSFTPTAQIGAYYVDLGTPAAAGVALTNALAPGTTYPVSAIAQPDCPRMLRIDLSGGWVCTEDLTFIVAYKVDVSAFSTSYTVPANTPAGTVLTFVSNANILPCATLTSVSCTPPAGWTAGTATFKTDDALQILPMYYYSSGTCTVQAEFSGTPGGVLVNSGAVGMLARDTLGAGVRPLYLPDHALDGVTQIKILVRIDDAPGGTVENHHHTQQVD